MSRRINPLVLVDEDRANFFGGIGTWSRILRTSTSWRAPDGRCWSGGCGDNLWLAWSWFGPGWAFEPAVPPTLKTQIQNLEAAHRAADDKQHRDELSRIGKQIRLGEHAGRLLWSLHLACMAARSSALTIPEPSLAAAVWGPERRRWPRHWRGQVLGTLKGLTWLHVAEGVQETPPQFSAGTVLLTHAQALRGLADQDVCDSACALHLGPPHHHLRVTLGRGFLGVLEQFARDGVNPGERVYDFPQATRGSGSTLREAGRTGRLISVFWPAEIPDPKSLKLSVRQRRLLRVVVRERTRPPRRPNKSADVAVVRSRSVPTLSGKSAEICPLLDATAEYAAFNGNGRRPGLGYLLMTPRGWLARAGYDADDVSCFFDDVRALAGPLGLVATGLADGPQWLGLDDLSGLAVTPAGRLRLRHVHLRLYGPVDWATRWVGQFHDVAKTVPTATCLSPDGVDLGGEVLGTGMSQRALAGALSVDPSFFGKILAGRKPWPSALVDRAKAWLRERSNPPWSSPSALLPAVAPPSVRTGADSPAAGARNLRVFEVATWYAAAGWSVIPMFAGKKIPHVRWKQYQAACPTADELSQWARQWPDAGLAVALGPVSGLFVIDVDGLEADEVLVQRLGGVPLTPKVISGSRKPGRYHLYFRHPDGVETQAKKTPWHPKLEFRGRGGLAVLPPSLHKFGNRYAWADGVAPGEIELAETPAAVIEALQRLACRSDEPAVGAPSTGTVPAGWFVSESTRRFLQGEFAQGPNWNNRLFQAACDLRSRQIPLVKAEPALLQGAAPWTPEDEEIAIQTIRSAYSQDRTPSLR